MTEAPATDLTVENDPITIVIETRLGPLVWTPIESMQEDLRRIAAVGELELTGAQLALSALMGEELSHAACTMDLILQSLREATEAGDLATAIRMVIDSLMAKKLMRMLDEVALLSVTALPEDFDGDFLPLIGDGVEEE